MKAYERLLNYAVINTRSDDRSDSVPSTAVQFDLAHFLIREMAELGIADARVDDKCYVYGSIPATPGYENVPAVMYCAHLDTADFNAVNVRPRVIENYDGNDVVLGDSGRVLSPKHFPDLAESKGQTLIVTDGTTLLGADDKAAIAEILTMAERVLTGNIPHGKLCFSFPPDEEIGGGAQYLDIPALGAVCGYTVDGGKAGIIEYETFNAAMAEIAIRGFGVHPGDAKNTMINALQVACELNDMLPAGDRPERTEKYEGFFHLISLGGTVDEAEMRYIVRDHDRALFEGRKKTLEHVASLLNEKYGAGTVTLSLRDQYYNMAEVLKDHMELVDHAVEATRRAGIPEIIMPIRGGTDGSQLSFRGLPTPNLGTGGFGFHGPYEHITAENMDLVTEILLNLVRIFAEQAE